MGLQLNGEFQQTTRCGDLILKDNTGLWNSVDNEGGWDPGDGSSGGNPALNWVTEAWLKLVFANGYEVTVNVLNTLLPFPNSGNGSITITAAMLGLSTNVPEGLIDATFWVVGANPDDDVEPGTLAIQYLKFFSLCSSECCVQKLQTKIVKGCDLCKSPEFKTWSDANDLLESLYDLVECKQYELAAITLLQIQEICKGNNCFCGCG